MEYRKEIDGLRAIAVIPVILFHARFPQFSGGFVGVDVFFVISGYLITTLILSEKETDTFSLVTFYERRARRIVPALFLVMLVSAIFAWFWLYPSHMEDFSKSLVAVSLFSSNILFWKETGYWGVENELKPLLHTWSLAVEEQYYVLFPLFLMFMWRFRKRWILSSFFFVAIGSLLLSQWAAFNNPTANFFLLPTRGWELAIGAGIAFYFLYRKQVIRSLLSHKAIDELLGWLGIALIGYAVFVFDEKTPFPSVYALVPTIGTALIIIFSSKETLVGKLLGSKIPVGIGLISYSAYLWHQPLFVFARHRSLHEPSSLLLVILSLASLLLAFISWKYVETPFRKKGIFSRKQIFSFVAIGSVIFITLGVAGQFTEGWKNRFDDRLLESVAKAEKRSFNIISCESDSETLFSDSDYCVLVSNNRKFAFLYGDSHAKAMVFEAKKAFSKTDYGLIQATTQACPPVKNVYRADNPDKRACYEKNKKVYDFIESNPQIEYVVMAARWTLGIEGVRFNNKEGGVELGRKTHLDIVANDKYLYHEEYSRRGAIAEAYINSVQELLDAGKKVILVYPVPEVGWNVPDYISRYYWVDPNMIYSEATASTNFDVYKARNKRAINALDRINDQNLFRVFPGKLFCNNDISGRCIVQKDGEIYYRDDNHLSDAGAKLVLEKVISYLRGHVSD